MSIAILAQPFSEINSFASYSLSVLQHASIPSHESNEGVEEGQERRGSIACNESDEGGEEGQEGRSGASAGNESDEGYEPFRFSDATSDSQTSRRDV